MVSWSNRLELWCSSSNTFRRYFSCYSTFFFKHGSEKIFKNVIILKKNHERYPHDKIQRKNIINLIKKSVDFLLINQFIDGSWKNSHALQVPNSKDITPIKMDFPIKTLGMNVRATEFNRLFTTSAILQSLVTYEQKYNPTTF